MTHDPLQMRPIQRWYLVLSLIAVSLGLSSYCLEYRVYDLDSDKSSGIPVIIFGTSLPTPPPAHTRLTVQQFWTAYEPVVTGLYAREGLTNGEAATGGLLIPALLLILAGFLALGSGKRKFEKIKTKLKTRLVPQEHRAAPTVVQEIGPIPTEPKEAKPTGIDFSNFMLLVIAFYPLLMIFDLPSAMLMTRNRYPRWVFVLHCFRAALLQAHPH